MSKILDELERHAKSSYSESTVGIEIADLLALIEVARAAHGLSFGVDWNKGTHAEIYRPKLIEALAELKGTK